jgi:cation diffusion facilitator family transporter
LSVISNTILVIIKLVVGVLIGSVSVISESIHSGVDLLAAAIALFAVKTSGKPADSDHPFGHGKVENISGTIEAILIFGAAAWIIYEAIHKLLRPSPLETLGWGIAVMLISSVANYLISRKLMQVGTETDSVALIADAWHLRTDVYTSAGVMVGLGCIWLGTILFPSVSLEWIDPVAAMLVALLIIKAAYDLTLQSGRDLLDTSLPASEESIIRDSVAQFSHSTTDMHHLRTRKAGSRRFIEFHLRVDPQMSIENAHKLSHSVAALIEERLPGAAVNIHLEPAFNRTDQPVS